MKVLSVTNAFPEDSITIGRFQHLVDRQDIDYNVFCWSSSKKSWAFWGSRFTAQQRKKVIVSGLSNLFSYKVIFEGFNILRAIITKPSLFKKHYSYFNGKGIKKYISALFDDYKILSLSPDILHFEFGTIGAKKIYLKDILNCKIVVSFRGYDLNYYKLDNPTFYHEVWRKADRFHFLGTDLLKRGVRRGYKESNNYYLIPPAIDTELFNRSTPRTDNATNALTVISVSRLVWKKAIDQGLLAFKRFLDLGGDGTYHIVGTGPAFEAIQFTAYELGIENKVIMHGKVKPADTKKLLERADVFLHPSISEGFCNAVIEAQAMELPVICSDSDGLPENVDDGTTGYVVKKWDYNTMGDKLFMLFNDAENRKQMGKNGRQRVINKFRIEDQVLRFEELYKSLQ